MIDLVWPRFSVMAFGALLLSVTAEPVAAQIRIDKDETGRIVAMANLATASGCARASGRGRVVDHHFENGEMKGVTFRDSRHGESYLNLPYLGTISPASARARVAEGFATLLVKGQELKVVTLGCGAAGRIEKLASVELVGPPVRSGSGAAVTNSPARPPIVAAAPPSDTGVRAEDGDDSVLRAPDGPATASAARPVPVPPTAQAPSELQTPAPRSPQTNRTSRWRLSQPTKGQVNLEISSNDRAFGLALDCTRRNGRLLFSNWFLPPRNWSIAKSATPLSIDGSALRWEVDGADEGLVFSDSTVDNTSALSANALDQLARGERLVVSGRTNRGKPRDAVFDIAGGEGSFAAFTERCQKLPRG